MLHVDASQPIQELKRLHRNLSREEVGRAISLAFNNTLSKQRTFLRRHIQRKYPNSALRASGYVQGKGIVIDRAKRRKLFAKMRVSSKKIPLIFFGAKQTDAGTSVEVTKGARKILPFSFIVKGRMPRKQVMARGNYKQGSGFDVRRKRLRSTGPDLPITKLVGTTVGRPDNDAWEQARHNAMIDVPKQVGRFFDKISKGVAR